jgi:hypothetical protein
MGVIDINFLNLKTKISVIEAAVRRKTLRHIKSFNILPRDCKMSLDFIANTLNKLNSYK